MGRSWLIALALTCACSKSKSAEDARAVPVETVAPADAAAPAVVAAPADAAPPKPPPHPVLRVETDAPVKAAKTAFKLRSYSTEGGGAVIKMSIGGRNVKFSDPPPGGEPKLVAWVRGFRVEVVDHGPGFVSLQVDKLTNGVVADSAMKVRVTRRRSADIGGGVSLHFIGHGHKHVAAGGPRSPLMVAVDYRRDGKKIARGDYNLYPPEEAKWTWRDYAFHLKKYDYGAFMDLRVTRRVLVPVAATE